jgi:hypothetical protein
MNINIIYDASVDNAPAGFTAAVADAVQYLDALFTNPVTINIDVGYGEVGGQALSSLGESLTYLTSVTYSRLKGALPAGTLPNSDPTNGGNFVIATAEAKALGLPGAGGSIDGDVGFSSTFPFTYDPNNRAVPGEYDFIGVVEHEITEVMGRSSMLGAGSYSLLDLFRYSAPGVHDFNGTQAGYFSIDGGVTNLDNFNTSPGGDFGDWAASAGHDAFLAFSSSGVMNAFSSSDLTLMNALGYGGVSPPPIGPTAVTAVIDQPATGALNAGKSDVITLDFDGPVTVAGGIPSLTLNDGGKATYSGGSGSSALTFNYTVASTDSNVGSLAATSVNPDGATIIDNAGHSANLSLIGLTQSGPQIDTTIPVVTAVIEQPATGTLNAGKSDVITLDFDGPVTVAGGIPSLALNDGGKATYSGGSGSSALTFNYTVASTDSSVASLAATSVNLNGATIIDAAGNTANLSLVGLTQSGPQIDTTIPVITAVIEQPANGDLNAGKAVTITLNMNEIVTVSGGTPTLMLNDHGVATYSSGSGTHSVVFHYTVGPNDSDVASLAVTSVNLDGATIQDVGGNIANLSLTGLTESGPQIDATSPVVTIISAGGLTSQPIQMVSGKVDPENVGTMVTLSDGTTQIGTAKVQADGGWSIDATFSGTGAHSLTAQDIDAAGNIGTSQAVAYTLSHTAPSVGILESLTPSEEIAAIYVGYFDRAPDAGGFAFWEGQYVTATAAPPTGRGLSTDQALTAIANSFAPQAETLALYPFLASGPLSPSSQADVAGVQALVASVYNNLFDRAVNAATDAGAQYWVHALLNGQVALGQAVLDIANGAIGSDAQVVLNKVIVSDYFAAATASAGLGVSSVPAALLAEAHAVLIGIGSDPAMIGIAEAKIDAFVHA